MSLGGRPQDVGRTRILDLQIRTYGDVLVKFARDVGKGRPLALHIDIMWTSSGRYIWTSLGRHTSKSKGRR